MQAPYKQPGPGARGFTLIELIISIVLLGLLGAVGVSMIYDSFDTSRMVNASHEKTAEARYILERLEREIREAKWVGTAFCTGTLANPATTFTFQRPITGSTDTDSCNTQVEAVTISLSGTALSLTKPAGTTAVLSNHVTAFSMHFLDMNNAETTSNAALRFVEIGLTVKSPISTATQQRTRIALRNTIQ
ncbi:MAG: prepilin-type N-terminal cleavage/methylation domain-containing protein [Rhodocyclaceae bacterium]|nr:prepilin-type N-terminal cleavage/methylation domain-containing protein [Rhodocyclaceae bacterium]MDZ4215090.1 prepilin-type N-terminal cleavage/methylation domain-containing protein [Rhodocyclaceae bacterium]